LEFEYKPYTLECDIMADILVRAGCFLAIIAMGFLLRRFGFFKEGDFRVISQITLKLTLPAAIAVSFAEISIEPAMLSIAFLALGGGVIYIAMSFLINLQTTKEQRAFAMLNTSGYNIGLFALPLVQSSLGPVGVVAASLFDVGNAFVCLGGAYGVASAVKDGSGFSFKRIGKALMTSVPFVTYIIMILLNFTGLRLPRAVLSFADIVRGANTFMAMLMIGVGFQLEINGSQLRQIVKIVLVRYGIATILALIFYHFLPFSLEIRQTLVLLVFSPIGSATPAFTAEMQSDVGLSSAVSSVCMLCSIIIMTTLMAVML
jgi:predicted permease